MSSRSRAFSFTCGLIALAAGPSRAAAQDFPKAVRDLVKQVTAFIDGKHGHGSGFVVLPRALLTNAHVVKQDLIEDLKARFIDDSGKETAYPVQLLATRRSTRWPPRPGGPTAT